MNTRQYDSKAFAIGWIITFLIRLIPFRPPNIEPILAAQMPFAKVYGKTAGFLFAFANIVLYDIITGYVGIWTFITAFAYGLLAIAAFRFFAWRGSGVRSYAEFAVIGTLLYDALTGLTVGPLFFGQTLMQAFIGQIPFTAMHLVGNVAFAVTLSPLIEWILIKKPSLKSVEVVRGGAHS